MESNLNYKRIDGKPFLIMMCGLQGAGKTTTTAKLAGKFKQKGKKPLLVACDVYRPAAIEQLKINGAKQEVEVFAMGDSKSPVDIAKAAIEHAAKNNFNVALNFRKGTGFNFLYKIVLVSF